MDQDQLVEFARDFREGFPKFTEEARKSVAAESWNKTGYRNAETYAIWLYFRSLAQRRSNDSGQGWTTYPKNGPGGGEYLVDFALFEDAYGPRIVCESQLGTRGGELAWAIDKLRGVKGDLKLLVYERKRNSQRKVPDESTSKIIRDYLAGYGLLSTNEVYLFIEFDHGDAIVYSFKPTKNGLHSDAEIAFDPIS